MRAIRLLPAGRALFDDLKVKPAEHLRQRPVLARQARPSGCARARPCRRAGCAPQPAAAPSSATTRSGLHWALIGVGVDPTAHLRADQLERWQRAGGKVWQWCHRSQAQHLAAAAQRLEALDETLLPRRAPLGWAVIVRPDRCVHGRRAGRAGRDHARAGARPHRARIAGTAASMPAWNPLSATDAA